VITPHRVYDNWPVRREFPRAVCIVSNRPSNAETATQSRGCGKPKTADVGFTRLLVAALYPFGLKRGVGLETISAFFTHLRLATQVGCSPSALRGVMAVLEAAMLETTEAWERDGVAAGEMREIIGAVDATFLQRMMLVFIDLVSGSLVFEEVAEHRPYDTWYALVEPR